MVFVFAVARQTGYETKLQDRSLLLRGHHTRPTFSGKTTELRRQTQPDIYIVSAFVYRSFSLQYAYFLYIWCSCCLHLVQFLPTFGVIYPYILNSFSLHLHSFSVQLAQFFLIFGIISPYSWHHFSLHLIQCFLSFGVVSLFFCPFPVVT